MNDCKQQLRDQCRHIAVMLENPPLVDDTGTPYDYDDVVLLECGLYATDNFETFADGEYEDTEGGWRIIETEEEIDSTDEVDIAGEDYTLVVIREGGDMKDLNPMSGYDYLTDVLDIEYRVGSDHEYRSAGVLVAFGGPSIVIDTKRNMVIGTWWGDHCEITYMDEIGLDDACRELFEDGS